MGSNIIAERFLGKTVIVTGAGSGIGKASAIRYALEGATVIATDIIQTRLDELKKELQGYPVTIVPGDISKEDIVQKIMLIANGKVDVLANIAGIMDGFLPAAEVDDATWERVMAVNVTAIMRLTRAVLPLMVKANSGTIVNVTSEAGLRGSAAGVAYTTSKHAVIGFTKSTSFMYASSGIRVNAVAPGPVKTNIEAPMKSSLAAARIGALMPVVLPPFASSEQLAACITWLSSEDSANINGVVLASDGGWSAL